MATNPVLVDSSWYITLTRERRDPLRELLAIATVRHVATCGVIRCEVARGIRNERDLIAFRRAWDVMLYVPTDHRVWADAESLSWTLDRQGSPLPLPDIIIAACARRLGAVVLTFDDHFQAIPGIKAVREII